MTTAGPALRLLYLPADRVCRGAWAAEADMLGGTCFSHPAAEPAAEDPPLLGVDMRLPSGQAPFCEVWQGREPLTAGRHGSIRYRKGETLLFGCLTLDEAAADLVPDRRSALQAATEAAYRTIFDLLDAQGYGAILRVWNYFPAINVVSHGIERYRQFNIGRQDAFLACERTVVDGVPAACALGSASGRLHVAFLAARAELTAIENPRQVSAYHYPSEYGPRSPTFSRASLVHLSGQDLLFISGTASIVGHQTLHEGDAAAQARESIENIAAVLGEANRSAPGAGFRMEDLAYKVYVRRPLDLDDVRRVLTERVGSAASIVFLFADVCRADLLVEIEASGGHAVTPMSPTGVST